MGKEITTTPQWKYLMQQQKGMALPPRQETYYTGEVVKVAKEQFTMVDGEIINNGQEGNWQQDMRGKTYKVLALGEAPDRSLLVAMSKEKKEKEKNQVVENIDPGPIETIDSQHWKSGHWKVAKLILKRDLERADTSWMTFGSSRAYRQYKLLQAFIEEKSQQLWDDDDDFSTKYLTKYRRAYSDFANKKLEWSVRRIASDFLTEVRGMLCLPRHNKL
tara:strand:- start:202 stop:855 length:654 start_codon:yes stop_codon:yes gene_type:complete